jgi:hypothetical protein
VLLLGKLWFKSIAANAAVSPASRRRIAKNLKFWE